MTDRQSAWVARIVADLVRHGVRYAVLSPGYRSAPLAMALHRHPSLHASVVVDERTAGFVALGLARRHGHGVVLACTSGSAVAHYLPAVVEARAGRLPLMLLTADRPDELHRVGAPQAMNQRNLFSSHVVYEDHLEAEPTALDEDVPATVHPTATRLAMAMAHLDRGPVHLNLPLRKPLHSPAKPETASTGPRVFAARSAMAPDGVEWLRSAVAAAQRPVLIAGPSARGRWSSTRPWWLRWAHELQWPVIADVLANVEPELGLRGAGWWLTPAVTEHLDADLLVLAGAMPTAKTIQQWVARSPAPVVAVADTVDWPDPTHRAAALLVGDVDESAMQRLLAQTPVQPEWRECWRTYSTRIEPILARYRDERWWDGGVVGRCLQTPELHWVHVASSLSIRDADGFAATVTVPITANRGLNGIDGTLATAWGQTIASERAGRGMVIVGDVAFAHDVGSLLQMPADLPLIVVVVDNGGGRIFERLPVRDQPDFEPLFVTPPHLDPVEVAASRGLAAEKVQSHAELSAALDRAHHHRGVYLIHAVTDATGSQRVRSQLSAEVEQALATHTKGMT